MDKPICEICYINEADFDGKICFKCEHLLASRGDSDELPDIE